MPSSPLQTVLQQLRAADERNGRGTTDGELLTRFLSQRDDDALAALVERHAPMVWGVCRRVLRNPHDAEDAFQATFLVLVRKATTVVPREMLANWLYGVAHQTAVRQRSTAAKRGVREMQMKDMPEPAIAEAPVSDLLPLLDQELSRLPEQHRVLIVLCDLEGKTRKEAAHQLGCPEGTVASRLARARDMLAKRMARHGLAVSGGSLAASLAQSGASAGVPHSVVSSTIKVATLLAANQAVGAISVSVAALTEGVLKTMLLKKIMTTTMAVLALGVAVITGGTLALGQTGGTGKTSDKPPVAAEKPIEKPPAVAEKPLVAKVAARDVVVNTPTILGTLQGEWELQPKAESEYKQRLRFITGNTGSWQRSEGTLPVTITYYVEGQELMIQHNYEPNGAFNYRLKQLRFEYAISNDKSILTLTAGDKTQTWKRIPKANPKQEGEKVATEKEAFIAWGKEVRGVQAGLGYPLGAKRVYGPGETVKLVIRVRNVSKEEVKFQYLRRRFVELPPYIFDENGKMVPFSGAGFDGVDRLEDVKLASGKEVDLYELKFKIWSVDDKVKFRPLTLYQSGKFQVQYEELGGNIGTEGKIKFDPVLGHLATGKLELEVKEPEKVPLDGKVVPPALTSKSLSGTWQGEKDGVKIQIVFFGDNDAKLKVTTESAGISAQLKRVDDKEPGIVHLRYDYFSTTTGKTGTEVIGRIERDKDGVLQLTILPVASKYAEYKPIERVPLKKVLTPEEAVKIAGDSELAKKFNATKPAVEFKVEFVTKAIQVKASGEKDAGWIPGHSPNDVCLGTVVAAEDPLRKTRLVAILTEQSIKQFNKAGINELEKHFKGKTVRVMGSISRRDYRGKGSIPEVEVVLDDMSQLEVVK